MSQDSLAQQAFSTKSRTKVNGDRGSVTVYFPKGVDYCILELCIDNSKSFAKASFGTGLDKVLAKYFKKLGYNSSMCSEIIGDINKKVSKLRKSA